MSLLHIAGGATEDKLYVEDVFATHLYTGNGSTQAINNGIDLAGKGGMVWTKARDIVLSHYLVDSSRGISGSVPALMTNTTGASVTGGWEYNPLSTGYSFNTNGSSINGIGNIYASWTFRKAPKFFDVQTKVHTTGTPSTIDLSTLGVVGMVTVKATNTTSNWFAWHKDLTAGNNLKLNLTDAPSTTNAYLSVSGTTLTISGSAPSGTYVIYAWAHDSSADGIIQCGSFTPSAGVDSVVSLGWEPQFLLVKSVVGGEVWRLLDVSRGMSLSGEQDLYPNQSNSESTLTGERFVPTATGFYYKTGMVYPNGSAVIYLAIRRPMKIPTSGTEVYNAIARTGTGAVATVSGVGFAPDLIIGRNKIASIASIGDRLRGRDKVFLMNTGTEYTSTATQDIKTFDMDGVTFQAPTQSNFNNSGVAEIDWFFKRAKGFFDIVCYTGTGVARTVNHNLGVVPELMIVKSRSGASNWYVYTESVGSGKTMYLQLTSVPLTSPTYWNNTSPTAPVFTAGTNSEINGAASTYVAYLFATLAGISKVGAYTGNGTSQTINCGFSTGARFILIKRTDATGDWYIWDTARGIVAANDPHLSLNTTAAEVTTDDSIDPASSGFIVNQVAATNINETSASYIFLAIA